MTSASRRAAVNPALTRSSPSNQSVPAAMGTSKIKLEKSPSLAPADNFTRLKMRK
jgi:hypothetical protein